MFILSFVRRSPLYLAVIIFILHRKGIALLSTAKRTVRRGDAFPHYDICRFEASWMKLLMGGQIAVSLRLQTKLVFATDSPDLTYFCDAIMAR
jgi:hypothetical protein